MGVVDFVPVEGLEFVPFGEEGYGVGLFEGGVGVGVDGDVLLYEGEYFGIRLGAAGLLAGKVEEVGADLRFGDFGVVDVDVGAVLQELPGNVDGGRFAGVVGVFLEGPAEEGNLFARNGVEEGVDDLAGKTVFLVVVHHYHLLPVGGYFRKAEVAAKVNQVQDVFLEAGAAETDGGFQEFGPDAAVGADGTGNLFDVGTGLLAKGRDGVDGGDALCQEGVGGKFRELRRPETGFQDAVCRYPVGIHGGQGVEGCLAGFVFVAPDEVEARAI